ncbi:MAG: hypothetical protein AB7I36_20375 [Rhodospirillaceae bacterium]
MTMPDEPNGDNQNQQSEAHPRALRIQTIITQSSGGMTRSELEEYADELTAEGLIQDTDLTT